VNKSFFSRYAAILLILLLCAGSLSGCSVFGRYNELTGYASGMTKPEKLSWGFGRLGNRLEDYIESCSYLDLLGAGDGGGSTVTSLKFSGEGAGSLEGGGIVISCASNGSDKAASVSLACGSSPSRFGLYFVDGDLYLRPADNSLSTVRLDLSGQASIIESGLGLLAASAACDYGLSGLLSEEELQKLVSKALKESISDDNYTSSRCEVDTGLKTVRAERIKLTLGEEEIYSIISIILDEYIRNSLALDNTRTGAYEPGYYYSSEWGEWEYLSADGALYYYVGGCWYAYGNIDIAAVLEKCVFLGKGEAARASMEEDGVLLFGPDTIFVEGDSVYAGAVPGFADYVEGYYYDEEYGLWYYLDLTNHVWAYYDAAGGFWCVDDYPDPDDFKFRSNGYKSDLGCPEYSGFDVGLYTQEGYYLDREGKWFYLDLSPGRRGWYSFDKYGGWNLYTYRYVWKDAEYMGGWDVSLGSEYGLVEYGTPFFGVYDEPGYYADADGRYYHFSDQGEYMGWYAYLPEYGWVFYGITYAYDDLTYKGEYDRSYQISEIGRPPLSLYEDRGYYTNGSVYFYCDGAGGLWYCFCDPRAYESDSAGWQYWSDTYLDDDLNYLGEDTDLCPAFEGIGSGAWEARKSELREDMAGIAFEASVDIYREDVIGVSVKLSLPEAMAGTKKTYSFGAIIWYSGPESYFRVNARIGGRGDVYFMARTGEGAETDYAGTFKYASDTPNGSRIVKCDFNADIDGDKADISGEVKIKEDGETVKSAEVDWTQIRYEGGSVAEGTYETDDNMKVVVTQTTENHAAGISPEGWEEGGKSFTGINGLLSYLAGTTLDEAGGLGYFIEAAADAFVFGKKGM
jgi:hypothetical protein